MWLNSASGYSTSADIPFARRLEADAPRLPYRRRKGEVKTVIHWGQRKLLLSEIEFLTLYGELSSSKVVVYAGAAPGTHISFLSMLFPELKFILYDPAPFTVPESDKINTIQDLFTDEVAKTFEGRNVLFICDIRSADWATMTVFNSNLIKLTIQRKMKRNRK